MSTGRGPKAWEEQCAIVRHDTYIPKKPQIIKKYVMHIIVSREEKLKLED